MADKTHQEQEKDFLDIDLDAAIGEQALLDAEALRAVSTTHKAPEKTGPGVLLFDNKKYAVGLNWLISEETDTELALRRAAGFKADFYCLRQSVASQQGFGFLGMGHRINMPALAAVAADMLVGEWHGVFTADNGWWYVAVHADCIAPDGDVLFSSEEEAYNHFVAASQGHRWPRAYAPETWNIQDSTGEIPLSKLLVEASPPVLKPVTLDAIFSGKRNKNLAIGAGLMILGLLGVSLLGQQLLPSLVPTPAQLPAPNLQVSDILQIPPKQVVSADGTLVDSLTSFSLPEPSGFIDACLGGASSVSMPLPGWEFKSLVCKDTFVESTWGRKIGSLSLVKPFLDHFPQGTARSFTDANTFKATRRLSGSRRMGAPADLLDEGPATLALSERLSMLGDLTLRTVTPPAGQELLAAVDQMQQAGFGNLTGAKPNMRPLSREDLPYISILLKSKTPPNLLSRYFDLPGVVLQAIESDVGNGIWQYTAKLILKPDNRLIEANNKAKTMQIR